MTHLIWTQGARGGLDATTDDPESAAPGVSSRRLAVIDRRTGLLSDLPHLSEFVPGLGRRKLTLIGFPYLLLDDGDDAEISVIRVYHAAQKRRPQ